jgi:hypothetical protein
VDRGDTHGDEPPRVDARRTAVKWAARGDGVARRRRRCCLLRVIWRGATPECLAGKRSMRTMPATVVAVT